MGRRITISGEILVVEDNTSDLELTLRALNEHGLAHNVCVARDGVEALEFLFCEGQFAHRVSEEQPQIVLLDLKLPLIDGVEVLRRMRTDARTHSIPVVALTSSTEQRDIAEAYRLGINSYITKPVDFDKFVEAIGLIAEYWLTLNRPLLPPHAIDYPRHQS